MLKFDDGPNLDIMSLVRDNRPEEQAERLTVESAAVFDRWLGRLRDRVAKARIAQYFDAVAATGRVKGDVKPIGGSVIEARFDIGPGYRVYLTQEGNELVLLLIGGDKSSQKRDIRRAKDLARKWRREHENA